MLKRNTGASEATDGIRVTSRTVIPLSEVKFQFSRSSGPGGQNVNRRETRVELLFDLQRSPSLNEGQRHRLLQRLAGQVDSEGVLHIVASSHRSQLRNRQAALERLTRLLQAGLRQPRRRKPTLPPPASAAQRLAAKRKRSATKSLRRPLSSDEGE
jgi:ribosome-associated protein